MTPTTPMAPVTPTGVAPGLDYDERFIRLWVTEAAGATAVGMEKLLPGAQ
ncbi:hypothetical protein ACWD4G_26595 [Streptomyces sp. NPDC002643]